MKGLMIILLYFLGIISTVLLGIYLASMVLFVFGNAEYPGEIAFIPKWIFLFSVFILLKKTETIKQMREWFYDAVSTLSNNLSKKIDDLFDNFFE